MLPVGYPDPRPSLFIPKLGLGPLVDGVVDDVCWSGGEVMLLW